MFAPIHAAITAENLEILQQILAMKEVNVDATALMHINKERNLNKTLSVGVIFAAALVKNLDILKLLLEHVQEPTICLVDHPDLGIPLPFCLKCGQM